MTKDHSELHEEKGAVVGDAAGSAVSLQALRALVERELQELLADPRVPQPFKVAFERSRKLWK